MQIYLPIAELSVNLFFLVGIGGAIGFLSGLFGVGGGFLLTPLLIFSGVPAPVAVASVTGQVVAASTSGALSYWRRGGIDLMLAAFLVLGGAVGSIVGVWIFAPCEPGPARSCHLIGFLIFLGAIGSLMLYEAIRSIIRSRRGRSAQDARPAHLGARPVAAHAVQEIPALYFGDPGHRHRLLIGIVVRCSASGAFILVPALVYLLRIPGSVVAGTSLLHVLAVMAVTCVLHAVQSQSVDILLAFCLMVGSVAGAQFGASAGQYLRGDQLRALLALIVLGVAIRFGLSLFLTPADPFSMAVIGFGESV